MRHPLAVIIISLVSVGLLDAQAGGAGGAGGGGTGSGQGTSPSGQSGQSGQSGRPSTGNPNQNGTNPGNNNQNGKSGQTGRNRNEKGTNSTGSGSNGSTGSGTIGTTGKHDVRVDQVPDPVIQDPRDAIIRVTTTAICGSDLHLYDGYIPTMEDGDILGHEFMGIVEEVGHQNGLKKGDRVIIPFQISCGQCYYCRRNLTALCENTNPNADKMKTLYGQSAAGLFGYSHLYGGYPGGQAEFVRVPCADFGAFKVPDELTDEQVIFLTDIFPTGFMAAENCGIEDGQTVAVWGCGPVGQFAIRSAFLLGAGRVIALDNVPERLEMAKAGGAEVLDDGEDDLQQKLLQMTDGRGPDHCIDAVGMVAHGNTLDAVYDRVKTAVMLETDRSHALRSAIQACAKGGTVSIPGVYGGFLDKFPLGAAFAKGLTLKMGQTNVHHYLPRLLDYIKNGQIDPSFVITHRLDLSDAATGYKTFHDKKEKCIKVVMKPSGV